MALAGGCREIGSCGDGRGRLIGMLSGLCALTPLAGDCGGCTMEAPTSFVARCAQASAAGPAQAQKSAATMAARTNCRAIESIESIESIGYSFAAVAPHRVSPFEQQSKGPRSIREPTIERTAIALRARCPGAAAE
ncbi:hypothetical protein C0Z19_05460 [Trinickia soli]|uniref:Uncharacterized protein n=1 Tax=Trinickia soli TaxID=380675 RepID=A0A2N7WCU0_9BURK|nr:hypothetical protein CIW54_19270 [Paraburkholderia sp. T12-10]PMS27194.1 hypothetical protein C0Z19_05460 [Trinickia soli]